MDETNPVVSDSNDELDELFSSDEVEGNEDVSGKDEAVSLEELNTISGREFKSKEDFNKHYENLKKLVGDQDLAKERKEKKEEDVKPDKVSELEKQLNEMKAENIKKDFLLEVPTAKEHLDLVEAYAEKQGISLSEAWSTKFSHLVESSQKSANVINKNRINPVQSQETAKLAQLAQSGDDKAQDALINSLVWGK